MFNCFWNKLLQALASMSMHTKLNICALIKQVTFPHKREPLWNWSTNLPTLEAVSHQPKRHWHVVKAWISIDKLLIIWKSDLTDKMKRSFFQAVVMSILLYGCTTWTLRKWLEKNVGSNIEQVLAATPHKAPTIEPPASHHENYPS